MMNIVILILLLNWLEGELKKFKKFEIEEDDNYEFKVVNIYWICFFVVFMGRFKFL